MKRRTGRLRKPLYLPLSGLLVVFELLVHPLAVMGELLKVYANKILPVIVAWRSLAVVLVIDSLIGCLRCRFGIVGLCDLYLGALITIKYYVSLHHTVNVFNTNTNNQKEKKTPKKQQNDF